MSKVSESGDDSILLTGALSGSIGLTQAGQAMTIGA